MGEVARGLNIPTEVSYKGKIYKLSWDFERQGMFEAWVEGRAWNAIERARVSNEVKAELRSNLLKSIAGGEYDFGSQTILSASKSIDGLVETLYLMMKPHHGNDSTVTPEFCRGILLDEMDMVIAKMNEAAPDPNSMTPEAVPGDTSVLQNSQPS